MGGCDLLGADFEKRVYGKTTVLLDFKVEDKELLDYLVMSWKYRDIVGHSTMMYQIERGKKGAKVS